MKYRLILIIFVLGMLGLAFYWFEIRPSQIMRLVMKLQLIRPATIPKWAMTYSITSACIATVCVLTEYLATTR